MNSSHSNVTRLFLLTTILTAVVVAFSPASSSHKPYQSLVTTTTSTTALFNTPDDQNFMRWARASRSAQADDTVVQMMRPLGLVLNEDKQGNVYVETVAPRGNAARTGKVKEGDIVTMCSATFGDEMWSTRGVGLARVLAAIRVRSGPVKLVFESPKGYQKKKAMTAQQLKARDDAAAVAQKKKDELLKQLESDEKRLKKGKFFGLF